MPVRLTYGGPAGPVAQWLEPAAHNGLVAGSSPAGPTSEINMLSGVFSPQRDHRTRYVRLSFVDRFALGDFLDGIRQIIGVMVPIGVEHDLERHSEITGCLPRIRALCISQVAAVCRNV
jgi:hypothetical protein